MKLAIALLVGSAIAGSAAAGAAELPSHKSPPTAAKAETCAIDGAPGAVLPGSGACVRISGSVSAQVSAGSLSR